jgi:drug/metabolite transporter (DMT)-like permease
LGEALTVAATPVILGALAYQIVIVAFISYLSWFWLISRYPAFKLSTFSFLAPLFGLAAGGLLLGEPITLSLLAAMTLVGLGIYLVNRNPAAAKPAGRPAPNAIPETERSGT